MDTVIVYLEDELQYMVSYPDESGNKCRCKEGAPNKHMSLILFAMLCLFKI